MRRTTAILIVTGLALVILFSGCKVISSPGGPKAKEPVRVRTESGLNQSVLYKNTYERTGTGYANRDYEADPTELWDHD